LDLAVNVAGLSKKFGSIQALNGISFKINQGEVYGLIGPNGAGKTTTLRVISTLILPSGGSASVFGYDVVKQPEEVRRILSYLPEEAGVYRNLSGYEYLQFMDKFSVSDTSQAIATAAEISDFVNKVKPIPI
jgi:ABC-2 type transport system ATP-binding protein